MKKLDLIQTTEEGESDSLPVETVLPPAPLPPKEWVQSWIQSTKDFLTQNQAQILKLNPSRRKALCHHLCSLAKHDYGDDLHSWLSSSKPEQKKALDTYFTETALFQLGQIFILKSWSDRKIRDFSEEDLTQLNWVFSSVLKPHIPLDRDGWGFTKPNLYSWFILPESLSTLLYQELKKFSFSTLSSQEFVQYLFSFYSESQSMFHSLLFDSLWDSLHKKLNHLPRKKVVFTPTLRIGQGIWSSTEERVLFGLEQSPLHLVLAEFSLLWSSPIPPSTLDQGIGPETYQGEQLGLFTSKYSFPVRTSHQQQLKSLETADLSWVSEEEKILFSSKSVLSKSFRNSVTEAKDLQSYLEPKTSQGLIQAYLSLSKLRNQGYLFYFRNDRLDFSDSEKMITKLFDQSKLISEIQLTHLEDHHHHAPTLPKWIYLFQKTDSIHENLDHRPYQVYVCGDVKNYLEYLPLFQILFDLESKPTTEKIKKQELEITKKISPYAQREWLKQWPTPVELSSESSACIELHSKEQKLFEIAKIQKIQNQDLTKKPTESMRNYTVLTPSIQNGKRKFQVSSEFKNKSYLVYGYETSQKCFLESYLSSELVSQWMDLHCEIRNDLWLCNDQLLGLLPVPKSLTSPKDLRSTKERFPHFDSRIMENPEAAFELWEKSLSFESVDQQNEEMSSFYQMLCTQKENWMKQHDLVFQVTQDASSMFWKKFISYFQGGSDFITWEKHPCFQILGSPDANELITSIRYSKFPLPTFSFFTKNKKNFQMKLSKSSFEPLVREYLDGLENFTWGEILESSKLPHTLDPILHAANDVLLERAKIDKKLSQFDKTMNSLLWKMFKTTRTVY